MPTKKKVTELSSVWENLNDTVHEASVAKVVKPCKTRIYNWNISLKFIQWLNFAGGFLFKKVHCINKL